MSELRSLRVNQGLTIRAAAKKMKVPVTTLAEAERGTRKPEVGNAFKIARFYGREVTDFWPVSDSPEPWDDDRQSQEAAA